MNNEGQCDKYSVLLLGNLQGVLQLMCFCNWAEGQITPNHRCDGRKTYQKEIYSAKKQKKFNQNTLILVKMYSLLLCKIQNIRLFI